MSLDPRTSPEEPAVPPTPPPAGRSRRLSPRARWAVPGVAAVVVAGAVGAQPLLASAEGSDLPELTVAELVERVAQAEPTPVQGTVVYTARLGLPELPTTEISGADPTALLGGSSTLRVWTDGVDRSRVSLLGAVSEYSVVRDGAEAWTYSSTDKDATHYRLDDAGQAAYDAAAARLADGVPETLPGVTGDLPTPQEAGEAALARAGEDATIELGEQATVAGRSAYEVVVTPTATSGGAPTLVDRIVVDVDGATSVPLRVQVWSTQDDEAPALEVGFTDVSFATPSDDVLTFSAPAGVEVTEVVVPTPDAAELAAARAEAEAAGAPTTIDPDAFDPETFDPTDPAYLPEGVAVAGSGFGTVVTLSDVDVAALLAGDPTALAPGRELTFGSESAQDLIDEFAPTDDAGNRTAPELDPSTLYEALTTQVPEGRLLSSSLLSVLVTDDGRVLVGAVPAQTLRDLA